MRLRVEWTKKCGEKCAKIVLGMWKEWLRGYIGRMERVVWGEKDRINGGKMK